MDEKKITKLRVLEKTQEDSVEKAEELSNEKVSYPNQTNPIYKKLMQFRNEKIGEKFSLKDLFR